MRKSDAGGELSAAGGELSAAGGACHHENGIGGTPGRGIDLPGFVNAHSHAFQRALRGRVEGRGGDFWAWRERMYQLALALDPDDVRVISRAAFLEMLLAGFTGVVEFHYLHHAADGERYQATTLLADAVLQAAADVGIRICLLETAYARAGAGEELHPAQRRFVDPSVDAFLRRAEELRARVQTLPRSSFGLALHSVRALPREWLTELARWARAGDFPVHMHVAEQEAEVQACLAEHGRRPLELLDELGWLSPRFTAVHAIHLADAEIALAGRAGAGVCACPSTEGNLGDGFVPATRLAEAGVGLCLGTDSHASIDPFLEMRELDYRERLRARSRIGLGSPAALMEAASENGRRSAGWSGRAMRGGESPSVAETPQENPLEENAERDLSDRVVLDSSHPALAGADRGSLEGHLVVAGSTGMVKEVYVGGERVVSDGRHPLQEQILGEFAALQRRLWNGK